MSSSLRPIIIWCHPRSCSTAFERAFIQRSDTRVLHEPLGDPFYFGGEARACRRYTDDECKERAPEAWKDGGVEAVLRGILEDARQQNDDGKGDLKYIMIKDMAQYIFPATILHSLHPSSSLFPSSASSPSPEIDLFSPVLHNPTSIPTDLLRQFTHTFLIRTPEKSVPSYWKCASEGASGFSDWDGSEAGYYELLMLYSYISTPTSSFHRPTPLSPHPELPFPQPTPAPLLSASDLLHDPHSAISSYCAAVGVPFDEKMLSWDSGEVKEFSRWEGYHKEAENSTGFRKEGEGPDPVDETKGEKKEVNGEKKKKDVPEVVTKTIEANMAAFNYLYARRTIRTNADDKSANTNSAAPDTPVLNANGTA